MKTKAQKKAQIESGVKGIAESETLVLADFTGVPTAELNAFRKTLRTMGAAFTVVKKRLFKLMLKEQGIEFDTKTLEGQLGVVFSPKDLIETAGATFRFSKGKGTFKILGGFNLKEKRYLEGADVIRYGALPTREVLLGQLVGMLTVPIRQFMTVLKEKATHSAGPSAVSLGTNRSGSS
ncbi:MAG: 50S ribosomal protein L10 [Candidatus Jorgensenbacteria bacterium]|nr:50S ribosomal protein L10 [Candidatus Jorgensenbacteria bacterium]